MNRTGTSPLAAAQWLRLRALLDEGLGVPPAERERWLAALDPADAPLRDRLRRLLSYDEQSLLGELPQIETAAFAAPPDDDATVCIGPYRLLREIGQGGMATVWLAERTDALQSRQVALKLPLVALSRERRATLAQRFVREREILATLEHPHIARLYDAGVSAEGQPWLALEYVDGRPITEWCRDTGASVSRRLEQVLHVCEAVAHAHGRLVVHRDLKPSNILIDSQGRVRLLDFGIAKLLTADSMDATELTQQGGRPFTPEYAAPEQVAALPLGVGVDVYALGVVLFELLAGTRPFTAARVGSRTALQQAVLERPPPKLSEVAAPADRARLRGDLDTIVAKALKKDPAERYASVEAFAADLRRHLAHEPVLARPDSAAYRLQRFVRRHRLGVAAAFLVLLAVFGGSAVALWQANEARAQRDEAVQAKALANRQADAARRALQLAEAQGVLADFLLSEAAVGMDNAAAAAQIERSLTMIRRSWRDAPALRAELLADAAVRLRWIGQDERARELFAEAEPLLRAADAHAGIVRILCMRAREEARRGRLEEGRRMIAEAAAALARLGEPDHYAHSGCLLEEAALARLGGDPLRAVALVEQALANEQRAGRGEREFTSEVLRSLARARMDAGQMKAAAETARESIALRARLAMDAGPGHWQAWNLLGMALREGGRPLEALSAFGGEGRFDPAGPEQSPTLRMQYAQGLTAAGRPADAIRLLQLVRRTMQGSANVGDQRNVATALAGALLAQGKPVAAAAVLDEIEPQLATIRQARRAAVRGHVLTRAQVALAARDAGAAEAAVAELKASIEASPASDAVWRGWHRVAAELALLRDQPQPALTEAEAALLRSMRLAIDPASSLHVGEDLLLRAQARQALGQRDEARADAASALRHAETAGGAEHPLVKRARAAVDEGRPIR